LSLKQKDGGEHAGAFQFPLLFMHTALHHREQGKSHWEYSRRVSKTNNPARRVCLVTCTSLFEPCGLSPASVGC
jgi:hypothetical protein